MTTIIREIREQFNPAKPSECIGQVELLTVDETKAVVAAAEAAFESWKNTSSVARGEILRVMADLLEKEIDHVAETASREMGKTKNEMIGEVKRGASILRYYAQEGMRATGEVLPSASEAKILYKTRPTWCCCSDYTVEFPCCHSVMENCPGVSVRQYGRLEAVD